EQAAVITARIRRPLRAFMDSPPKGKTYRTGIESPIQRRIGMRYAFRAVAFTLLIGCAIGLTAQEKAKKPAGPPDEKAMMEAMQKAATPGEAHKKLEPLVGTFDTSVRMWMDPSKPPEDSAGTTANSWVLGNRYVEQRYEGTFMGEPFSGIGFIGY